MSAYLSRGALALLDQAQAALELHLVTGVDGRCLGCCEPEPCAERTRMSALFARYERLPRRRPGITKAGLRCFQPTKSAQWFGTS